MTPFLPPGGRPLSQWATLRLPPFKSRTASLRRAGYNAALAMEPWISGPEDRNQSLHFRLQRTRRFVSNNPEPLMIQLHSAERGRARPRDPER